MEKNQLKFYETPSVEVVEMEVQGILCVSTSDPDIDIEEPNIK